MAISSPTADTPMNTDDRALADLIAELRYLEQNGSANTRERAAYRNAADRLEAFHAKPVVGEREAVARAHAQHSSIDPWWWHTSFDDGADETATHLREQDFLAADDILAALQSPPPVVSGEAASYADFQQRRGRLPDLIEEAISIYDGFMKDDDYNAQGCLDSVVAKLRSARDWYPDRDPAILALTPVAE